MAEVKNSDTLQDLMAYVVNIRVSYQKDNEEQQIEFNGLVIGLHKGCKISLAYFEDFESKSMNDYKWEIDFYRGEKFERVYPVWVGDSRHRDSKFFLFILSRDLPKFLGPSELKTFEIESALKYAPAKESPENLLLKLRNKMSSHNKDEPTEKELIPYFEKLDGTNRSAECTRLRFNKKGHFLGFLSREGVKVLLNGWHLDFIREYLENFSKFEDALDKMLNGQFLAGNEMLF